MFAWEKGEGSAPTLLQQSQLCGDPGAWKETSENKQAFQRVLEAPPSETLHAVEII